MLTDLKNSRLIHFKGWLFLLLGFVSGGVLVAQSLDYKEALLLVICVWSFCRFYYYAFYVVEKYVDPGYRFSGLLSFASYFLRRKNR